MCYTVVLIYIYMYGRKIYARWNNFSTNLPPWCLYTIYIIHYASYRHIYIYYIKYNIIICTRWSEQQLYKILYIEFVFKMALRIFTKRGGECIIPRFEWRKNDLCGHVSNAGGKNHSTGMKKSKNGRASLRVQSILFRNVLKTFIYFIGSKKITVRCNFSATFNLNIAVLRILKRTVEFSRSTGKPLSLGNNIFLFLPWL